jgi:hypothetical protein
MDSHRSPLERIVRRLPRGKTEADAIAAEMHYSDDQECPECGCPWYANKNLCGEGHRTCYDCTQEWWTNVSYTEPAQRRELPEASNAGLSGHGPKEPK